MAYLKEKDESDSDGKGIMKEWTGVEFSSTTQNQADKDYSKVISMVMG